MLNECCGSRDGQYFTVSFTGEQDLMLRVLRQLAFDYRGNNTSFRNKIESHFQDVSALEVYVQPTDGSSEPLSPPSSSSASAPPPSPPHATQTYLSVLSTCGESAKDAEGWVYYEGTCSCYALRWATSVDFDGAKCECEKEGAALVLPASEAENGFVARLQDGCRGWVDMKRVGVHDKVVTGFSAWDDQVWRRRSIGGDDGAQHADAVPQDICAYMNGTSGLWTSVACTRLLIDGQHVPFACAKPAHECRLYLLRHVEWSIHGQTCLLRQTAGLSWGLTTWQHVRDHCRQMGAVVALPTSQRTNDDLRVVLGPAGGLIGLHRGVTEQDYRRDMWDEPLLRKPVDAHELGSTPSAPPSRGPQCYHIRRDTGAWLVTPCDLPLSHGAICKRAASPTVASCTCPSEWSSFDCSCYRHFDPNTSSHAWDWFTAHRSCDALGSQLVDITSSSENDMVKQLLPTTATAAFIGLNDLAHPGKLEWGFYRKWAPLLPHQVTLTQHAEKDGAFACVHLERDGSWTWSSCDASAPQSTTFAAAAAAAVQHASKHTAECFVCKRAARARRAVVASASDATTWRFVEAGNGTNETDGVPLHIQHVETGAWLACSTQTGELELEYTPTADEPRTLFLAQCNQETGRFSLCQRCPGSPGQPLTITVDSSSGELHCDPQQGLSGRSVVWLHATTRLNWLARRHLRISIVSQSQDLRLQGYQECSMRAYDTTPTTESYTCAFVQSNRDDVAADQVWLEQQALLVMDQSVYVMPRQPIEFAHTRCENQAISSYVICTFGFGQGLTVARVLTIDWNYLVFNVWTCIVDMLARRSETFRLPWSTPPPTEFETIEAPIPTLEPTMSFSVAEEKNFQNDFIAAYNNIYEVIQIKAYVETRNWQITIPVEPQSTLTVQLFVEAVMLRYRWRTLFQARGSFRILYFGEPIGSHHSIADLTSYDDVFFYLFGRYERPLSVQLTYTVNDKAEERWVTPLPPYSLAETSDQSVSGLKRGTWVE